MMGKCSFRMWAPTDDPPRYGDVTSCPKRFSWRDDALPVHTFETGVLVDLDVDG